MHRFFLQAPLTPELCITGQDAHHISRVLRMKPGDEIIVVAADGQAGVAVLTAFSGQEVKAELRELQPDSNEAPVAVSLAQCLPKSDKMDYIIQKAVELGVRAIYPVAAARSVVKYDRDKLAVRQERWQKIAGEAAKQCRRTRIPEVKPIQRLEELLTGLTEKTVVLLLYEGSTPQGIKNFLSRCQAEEYLVLIGPEGGFDDREVALCRQHAVHFLTMGPRILRTETAALAALSLVLYEKGDLGG